MNKIKIAFFIIFLLFFLSTVSYSQEKISITLDIINDTVGEVENYYIEIKIENNYSKGIAIKSNISSFYNFKIKNDEGKLIDNSWWFKEKIYETKTNDRINIDKTIEVFEYNLLKRVPHRIVKMNPFNEVFILKKSDYSKFRWLQKRHKIYEDRLIFVIPDDYTKNYYIEPHQKIIMKQKVNNLVRSGKTYYINYVIKDSLSSREYKPGRISTLQSENVDGILVLLYDDLYYFIGTIKSNTILINKRQN